MMGPRSYWARLVSLHPDVITDYFERLAALPESCSGDINMNFTPQNAVRNGLAGGSVHDATRIGYFDLTPDGWVKPRRWAVSVDVNMALLRRIAVCDDAGCSGGKPTLSKKKSRYQDTGLVLGLVEDAVRGYIKNPLSVDNKPQ